MFQTCSKHILFVSSHENYYLDTNYEASSRPLGLRLELRNSGPGLITLKYLFMVLTKGCVFQKCPSGRSKRDFKIARERQAKEGPWVSGWAMGRPFNESEELICMTRNLVIHLSSI